MFIPGKRVSEFETAGKKVCIRYPLWRDIDSLVNYINLLSSEDTYVLISGIKVSKEEEAKWLAEKFVNLESGRKIVLFAESEGKIIGIAEAKEKAGFYNQREAHTKSVSISVHKDFRSKGIGRKLMNSLIAEVRRNMPEVKILILSVFAVNKSALRLYESLGFVKYGVLKKGIFYRDRYVD